MRPAESALTRMKNSKRLPGSNSLRKGDQAMVGRLILERTRVMIVEEDWEFGIKLADGLAARGYHPVLFRFVDAAITELDSIRPRGVLVGLQPAEPAAQNDASEALILIRAICSRVPVITVADTVGEDLTTVVIRQGLRRFEFKPIEFSQVGDVLRSELTVAAA